MTDDIEDEGGGELECTIEPPDFRSEYIEWSAPSGDGGTIIAVGGAVIGLFGLYNFVK